MDRMFGSKWQLVELVEHALNFNPKTDPESCHGWSGYMSMVMYSYILKLHVETTSADYPDKSMVHMMPIIDLDPNGMSCI